jgi:hypothetical protein
VDIGDIGWNSEQKRQYIAGISGNVWHQIPLDRTWLDEEEEDVQQFSISNNILL